MEAKSQVKNHTLISILFQKRLQNLEFLLTSVLAVQTTTPSTNEGGCGSEFGCCVDGLLPAVGPNNLGCPGACSVPFTFEKTLTIFASILGHCLTIGFTL